MKRKEQFLKMLDGAYDWLRSPFGKLVLVSGGLLAVSSLGYYFFEIKAADKAPEFTGGLFGALYWSVVTLTTVGYGDMVPASFPGRVLGMIVMLSGIGLVSALSGNLASFLVDRKAKKRGGLLQVNLYRHIIILGWNDYAVELVRTLRSNFGTRTLELVIVGELDENTRDNIAYVLDMGEHLQFVVGDTSQKNILNRASPENAAVAFILSVSDLQPQEADQRSIYTALTLHSMAPKLPMYGEVVLPENREHLLRAGVGETIVRGELTSHILGHMGAAPSIWPFLKTLLGLQSAGVLSYRRLNADERQLNWGALLQQLRTNEGALPLALCREVKSLRLEDVLDDGSALDKFILELFAASGKQTQFGQESSSSVVVNPSDTEQLMLYDGLFYLKSKAEVE